MNARLGCEISEWKILHWFRTFLIYVVNNKKTIAGQFIKIWHSFIWNTKWAVIYVN